MRNSEHFKRSNPIAGKNPTPQEIVVKVTSNQGAFQRLEKNYPNQAKTLRDYVAHTQQLAVSDTYQQPSLKPTADKVRKADWQIFENAIASLGAEDIQKVTAHMQKEIAGSVGHASEEVKAAIAQATDLMLSVSEMQSPPSNERKV